jgi:cyclophilin family peptidyl-prolyl cis-trans isomerase
MPWILALAALLALASCAPEVLDAEKKDGGAVAAETGAKPEPAKEEPRAEYAKADADPGPLKIEKGPDGKPKTAAENYVEPKKGDPVVVLKTNYGHIVLSFYKDKAPKHVENFLALAKAGFYDGTRFHRVIPGFMVQGGDPNSKNADRSDDGQGGNVVGGKEKNVKAEFNDVKFTPGILGMARSADEDSASSQFFIMVADYPSLNGKYTAFGQVVSGMDVAEKIVALPRDSNDNPLAANPAVLQKAEVKTWPIP